MDILELRDLVYSVGHSPRIHPNGFLQLDLTEHQEGASGHSGGSRRLHIWNPTDVELPRQKTASPVHNHVFDMESTVIKGSLTQVLYVLDEDPSEDDITHEKYIAEYDGLNSVLVASDIVGNLMEQERFDVKAGESYTQPAFTFHDSVPASDLVVTLMEKQEIHEGEATILIPVGQEPDNEYDRTLGLSDEQLWQAIDASLNED